MSAGDFVSERAIDYDEIFRRGGRTHGDEAFALFKCPLCGRLYLFEYEVDTVYLDGRDLSRRVPMAIAGSFECVGCLEAVPQGRGRGHA